MSGITIGQSKPATTTSPGMAPIGTTPPAPNFETLSGQNVYKAPPTTAAITSAFAPKQPIQTGTGQANLNPYFSAVDKVGNSYGFSNQTDSSGKPYFAYRAPGDTSTTTDTTRVATTFDPRVAQILSPSVVQNGRMPLSVSAPIKAAMGGNYSDELDHTIALELSGSNNPSNLRIEPGIKGGESATFDKEENALAHLVATGQMSLWDAQTKLATDKNTAGDKNPIPFTGAKPSDNPVDTSKIFSNFTPTKIDASKLPGTTISSATDSQGNPLSTAANGIQRALSSIPGIQNYMQVKNSLTDDVGNAFDAALSSTENFVRTLSSGNPNPTASRNPNANTNNATLDKQATALTTQKSTLDTAQQALTALGAKIDAAKENVDTTNQSSVDAFNAMVDQYTAQEKTLQSQIDSYNNGVNAYQKAQNDLLQQNGTPVDIWGNPTTPPTPAQRVGAGLDAVTKISDAIFSLTLIPTLTRVAASDPNPVFSIPAQIVGNTFGAVNTILTQGTDALFKGAVKTGLISQATSDALDAPVGNLLSLLSQIYVGKLALEKGVPAVKNAISDIQTMLTKDVITTHAPEQTMYFNPAAVKDIWQTGTTLSEQDKTTILQIIGGDSAKIKDAIQNGIPIKVSPKTIVQLIDKPYWASIKSMFGVDSAPIKVSESGGVPSQTVRGYLDSSSSFKPPATPELDTLTGNNPDIKAGFINQVRTTSSGIGPAATTQAVTEAGHPPELAGPAVRQALAPQHGAELQAVRAATAPTVTSPNETTPNAIAPMGATQTKITVGAQKGNRLSGESTVKGNEVTNQNTKVSYKSIDGIGNGKQPISVIEKGLAANGVSAADVKSILSRTPKIDGQTWTDNVFDAITAHNDAVKALSDSKSPEQTRADEMATLGPSKARTTEQIREEAKAAGVDKSVKTTGEKGQVDEHGQPTGAKYEPTLVNKSDIKTLIDAHPELEANPELTVDDNKNLTFKGTDSSFTLKPSAMGLNADTLIPGEKIRIDVAGLKDKGVQQMRIFRGGGARGFINIGAMVEGISDKAAEVKQLVQQTQTVIKVTGDITFDMIKLQGSDQADVEGVQKIMDGIIKEGSLTVADDQAIYHKIEEPLNPTAEKIPATEHQKTISERYIEPTLKINAALAANIKEAGYEAPSEGYIHRERKGTGGAMEKLLNPTDTPRLSAGGLLTKSDSSFKGRTMFAYTNDATGERNVVHEGDHVTVFRNGEARDLGPIDAKIPPKVKEFYDPSVQGKLETLAKELGVTHQRVATGKSKGLGGNRAGVSFPGKDLIKTRLSNDQVLAHELGHQIDYKYGLQAVIKDAQGYGAGRKAEIQAEMRALADARFGNADTTSKSFQAYVRKGTEKMAVMFEAYVSNKDMFQEIAPHLYDDFRDFLASHAELKPFLDIKGSLETGVKVHGGKLERGLKGNTFIGKDGQRYTKSQATTKEITTHAGIEYHESALASALTQFLRLSKINRAIQFLESWKDNPAGKDVIGKMNDPDAPLPSAWVPYQTPQFRGYAGPADTVAAVDSFYNKANANPHLILKMLGGINRLLTSAIFYNPIAHPLNATALGLVDLSPHLINPFAYPALGRSFAKAYTAIVTKNANYIHALQEGAPITSSIINAKNVADGMYTMLTNEMDKNAALGDRLANAFTFKNANDFRKQIGAQWHRAAFIWTDLFSMTSTYMRMERRGMSFEEATRDSTRFNPDYRLPPNLPGKSMLESPLNPLFAFPYHFGLMKSLGNIARDIAAPKDWKQDGEQRTGAQREQQRADAVVRAAMVALLAAVIYPWLSSEAKKLTGNLLSYVSPSGSIAPVTGAYKLLTGQENPVTFGEAIAGPSPFAKAAVELSTNIDWFTRNPIYGPPPAIGMGAFLTGLVSPLDTASRMTPEDVALSLLNIHTPKSAPGKTALDTQIYEEKPALLTIVKNLMLAGQTDEANAKLKDFNDRIIQNYQAWMQQTGQPLLTPAQIPALLKADGLATPGLKAMNTAAARARAKGPTPKTLLQDFGL